MDQYIELTEPERFTKSYKVGFLFNSTLMLLTLCVALTVLCRHLAQQLGFLAYRQVWNIYDGGAICTLIGFGTPLMLFMPWMSGNTLLAKWNHSARDEAVERGSPAFCVEINLDPPLIQGLEKLADNADDVGVLIVEEEHLRYEGDAVRFRVPRAGMVSLMSGRAWWKCSIWNGELISVQLLRPLDKYVRVSILCREGSTIFRSRERARELRRCLGAWLDKAETDVAAPVK